MEMMTFIRKIGYTKHSYASSEIQLHDMFIKKIIIDQLLTNFMSVLHYTSY